MTHACERPRFVATPGIIQGIAAAGDIKVARHARIRLAERGVVWLEVQRTLRQGRFVIVGSHEDSKGFSVDGRVHRLRVDGDPPVRLAVTIGNDDSLEKLRMFVCTVYVLDRDGDA